MRNRLIGAAVLLGVGLALFFFLRSADPERSLGSDAVGGSERVEASPERPRPAPQLEAPEDLGARGSADPGSTPGLAQPPSEADGVLEVEVLAGERPVPGATARLYWRGPRDPNLNEVSWRLASTGTTDAQGRARLPSRSGSYMVAVRAQGYGPLLRDVVRAHGEARTLLRLALEPGQVLSGRTVEADTKEPLPLVELILTAHGQKLPMWQSAQAPPEERAYASSNARGDFRVEGLSPGDYLLEARAAGYARTQLGRVRVPNAGSLTVELRKACVIEGFVVDAQGRPAAGAQVQVGGRVAVEATTGEGGGFSVEVEPGPHVLSARRGSEAGSLRGPIIASAGKTVRDLRIQLGQSAMLEGSVVALSTGAPVPGARVDVSPHGTSGDSGRAVTDDAGRFSVSGLAPGSYDLVATAPGFATVSREGLTVAWGERFSLALKLPGTGAVEGTVRDKAGQPVSGAQVKGDSRWTDFQNNATLEARTDAAGHYRLEGLSAGGLFLMARSEGATTGVSERGEVKEGETTTLDFTLEDTGIVEGVVRVAAGAQPPEPLSVLVSQRSRSAFYTEPNRADVDAAGRFRMVLPQGKYSLQVSPELRRSSPPKWIDVEAGKTLQVELSWSPPEDASATNGIRGIVLEPDGTPSPGAVVTMAFEGPRAMSRLERADLAGRFSFSFDSRDTVTPTSRLRVNSRNDGRTGEVQGVKPGEQSVVVRLQPSASVRGRVVSTGGGAPVKGFSVSLEMQGQAIRLGELGPWEFPGDRFELGEVPEGAVKVRVQTEEGAMGEALVSTRSGAVAEVQVAVKSPAAVRGRVMDATTKQPLADARLLLEGAETLGSVGRTDAEGRFSLARVTPGSYTLMVTGGERMPARQTVTLAEGQVLDVGDISLSPLRLPPGSVGAMVRQEEGQVLIDSLAPDSPAAAAGLQVGDVLLTVNGAPVLTPLDAFQRLRGAPSSTVVVTVRRAGSERSFSIIRAP